MAVAVQADLVSRVDDSFHLVGKGLDRMARHEPGRLHLVFVEQLDEARRADLAREQAARNVERRVFARRTSRANPRPHPRRRRTSTEFLLASFTLNAYRTGSGETRNREHGESLGVTVRKTQAAANNPQLINLDSQSVLGGDWAVDSLCEEDQGCQPAVARTKGVAVGDSRDDLFVAHQTLAKRALCRDGFASGPTYGWFSIQCRAMSIRRQIQTFSRLRT